MCGIFGYIGNEQKGTQKVYEGLKRLDYRGYDSWGLGILKDSKIIVEKHAGKIPLLFPSLPESNIVVGHTRWATHGAVNELNAHPHFASDHTFVLAQNGIVENFEELKKLLIEKGYQFKTQTDTEIIVRLIEEKKKQFDTLQESIRQAFLELEGRNTIIVMATDGTVIGARNGSPLVIGKKTDTNDIYYSSDTLSFSHNADQVVVLENGQMISCTNGQLELTDIMSGQKKQINWEKIHVENGSSEKLGFPHFMLKEIHENPEVIQRVTEQDSELLKKLANKIQTTDHWYSSVQT